MLPAQESFVRAKNWVKELQRQASPNIVIALAGNKADLASKRALDFQVRQNTPYPFAQPFFFFLVLPNEVATESFNIVSDESFRVLKIVLEGGALGMCPSAR